jgi:hypothetical protein
MDTWGWASTAGGTVLVLVALTDVLLSVLHIDSNGPISRTVNLLVWKLTIALGRMIGSARRGLYAAAGPFMTVASFFVWVVLFIVGFALIYWPWLEHFRKEDALGPLGFIDALYFSGITGSVLGYGDISPTIPGLQILSVTQSLLGFALLTGIVTYLISLVNGVSERVAVAMRVWCDTGSTGDGVAAVIRSCSSEQDTDVRDRCVILIQSLQSLFSTMRQFEILDLYYRSKEPVYDPELLFRSSAEIAMSLQLLARTEEWRRLHPVVEDLTSTLLLLYGQVAAHHLGNEVHRDIVRPVPEDVDRKAVISVRERLEKGLGVDLISVVQDEGPATFSFQTRVFLQALDLKTGWRQDHGDGVFLFQKKTA